MAVLNLECHISIDIVDITVEMHDGTFDTHVFHVSARMPGLSQDIFSPGSRRSALGG